MLLRLGVATGYPSMDEAELGAMTAEELTEEGMPEEISKELDGRAEKGELSGASEDAAAEVMKDTGADEKLEEGMGGVEDSGSSLQASDSEEDAACEEVTEDTGAEVMLEGVADVIVELSGSSVQSSEEEAAAEEVMEDTGAEEMLEGGADVMVELSGSSGQSSYSEEDGAADDRDDGIELLLVMTMLLETAMLLLEGAMVELDWQGGGGSPDVFTQEQKSCCWPLNS